MPVWRNCMSKLHTSAACACMLGVDHEDKHICGAADFVCVSGGDPCAGLGLALLGARGSLEGGQLYLCSFYSMRDCNLHEDASAPVEAVELQGWMCFTSCLPAVGAGSVLPLSLLPCPWHTSSMQEVNVLPLATLICKHSCGCPA